MKIQKLKSGLDTYYSCDLLDQSNGVNGFSNVKFLMLENGDSSTITNNIIYYDDIDEFILESFNKIDNTPLIIEEDIFGNKKAWLKESNYCKNIIDSIKNNNLISFNILEEVISESLKNYYKENKLNISIVNGLSNTQRKQAYKEINPEEMINNFIHIAIEEDLKFNIENNQCKVLINENTFSKIKENMKKNALNVIQVKNLLRTRASTLNDLIVNPKNKIKNKI